MSASHSAECATRRQNMAVDINKHHGLPNSRLLLSRQVRNSQTNPDAVAALFPHTRLLSYGQYFRVPPQVTLRRRRGSRDLPLEAEGTAINKGGGDSKLNRQCAVQEHSSVCLNYGRSGQSVAYLFEISSRVRPRHSKVRFWRAERKL